MKQVNNLALLILALLLFSLMITKISSSKTKKLSHSIMLGNSAKEVKEIGGTCAQRVVAIVRSTWIWRRKHHKHHHKHHKHDDHKNDDHKYDDHKKDDHKKDDHKHDDHKHHHHKHDDDEEEDDDDHKKDDHKDDNHKHDDHKHDHKHHHNKHNEKLKHELFEKSLSEVEKHDKLKDSDLNSLIKAVQTFKIKEKGFKAEKEGIRQLDHGQQKVQKKELRKKEDKTIKKAAAHILKFILVRNSIPKLMKFTIVRMLHDLKHRKHNVIDLVKPMVVSWLRTYEKKGTNKKGKHKGHECDHLAPLGKSAVKAAIKYRHLYKHHKHHKHHKDHKDHKDPKQDKHRHD